MMQNVWLSDVDKIDETEFCPNCERANPHHYDNCTPEMRELVWSHVNARIKSTVTQTLYQIQATVNGRQVPTFYLDAQVQGILNIASAEKIARDIIKSAMPSDIVHRGIVVSAMEINYEIQPWNNE